MSVWRIFGFTARNTQVWKPPTFTIAVIWRHRTGREKERKTFIKQHADWYWPLHVVTMQGAKHHMQVIFRDLRGWRRKNADLWRGAFGLARWPLAYESQTEQRASRNIKSDLGEAWTRSRGDKICECALMLRLERIGPNCTHLHHKIIM